MAASSKQFPHYVQMIQDMHLNPAIIFTMKSILVLPLVYHTLNGIRHLVSFAFTFKDEFHLTS